VSHREVNAASRSMCLPHLQAPQTSALRKSTSAYSECYRNMLHKDRQCMDNSEGRCTPVVSQQGTSTATDVCMAEAEPADVSVRLEK
jgi:hypothetical protein